MRKTDKKTDNQIRLALTDVCDTSLKDIDGFVWLTHLVNYDSFPSSLKVVCVFETDDAYKAYQSSASSAVLESRIIDCFKDLNIKIKKPAKKTGY